MRWLGICASFAPARARRDERKREAPGGRFARRPDKIKALENEVIKDEYNRDGVNNAPGDDYGIGDIFLF